MNALIELVCRAHAQRHTVGPLITRVDGIWAYCEGNAPSDHDWRRIEPTGREHLGGLEELQDRRAS